MAISRLQGSSVIGKVLLTCCMALAIAGCSHRVLTIFFTGVPDPNAPETQVSAVEEELTDIVDTLVRDIPPQEHFTHGPWVNRQCQLCHAARGGQKFNAVTTVGNSQARLSIAKEDLCTGCHAEERFVGSDNSLWQHGPVANGSCTTCHNPHKSKRQFMLLANDNRALCGECHYDNTAPTEKVHGEQSDTDCVNCHDPHASRGAMLLKAGLMQ